MVDFFSETIFNLVLGQCRSKAFIMCMLTHSIFSERQIKAWQQNRLLYHAVTQKTSQSESDLLCQAGLLSAPGTPSNLMPGGTVPKLVLYDWGTDILLVLIYLTDLYYFHLVCPVKQNNLWLCIQLKCQLTLQLRVKTRRQRALPFRLLFSSVFSMSKIVYQGSVLEPIFFLPSIHCVCLLNPTGINQIKHVLAIGTWRRCQSPAVVGGQHGQVTGLTALLFAFCLNLICFKKPDSIYMQMTLMWLSFSTSAMENLSNRPLNFRSTFHS